MRIVHIAPNAPYNEGWSYQENLLPKYQKKLGHDVTLIITNTMHAGGSVVTTDCCNKIMSDGVRLIRRPTKTLRGPKLLEPFISYMDVFSYLVELRPDFIFFHGLVSATILQVVKYKKRINPKCVVVQDNHLDPIIGDTHHGFIYYLYRFYYRMLHRITDSYINRVYGVTPWRKQYAADYFGVSPTKTDMIIMGADDEAMDYEHHNDYRNSIREKYTISDKEFLVVSGGKIEDNKKVDVLIEACGNVKGVRLLLFGSVDKSVESNIQRLLDKFPNILYVGWIDAKDCYKYFYAADLVCFPGRHSVLWEQACASKVPCIIKRWDGMNHVDVGGNALLLDNITNSSLRNTIVSLQFTDRYFKMLEIAQSSLTDVFLYSEIAKKSINDFIELYSEN